MPAGWALCGHKAPAGQGRADGASDSDDEDCNRLAAAGGHVSEPSASHAAAEAPAATAAADGTTALPANVAAAAAAGAAAPSAAGASGAQPIASADAPGAALLPYLLLPRERRMAVGQKCKELLDLGRWHWLRRVCPGAQLVEYIEPEVSGENRLLVAAAAVDTASCERS